MPDGTVKTVVSSPHVDGHDEDELYCAVIPISMDPNDQDWSKDSYHLVLPGISVDIELKPMDICFFPSSLLVHYNTSFKAGGDVPRASIVMFVHASLVKMLAANGEIPRAHPELVNKAAEIRAGIKFQDGTAHSKRP